VLSDVALCHLIKHFKHTANGGKILFLDEFFKEFRILFGKVWNALPNDIFRVALCEPERNISHHLANGSGSFRGIKINGAGLCFGGGILNALALGSG